MSKKVTDTENQVFEEIIEKEKASVVSNSNDLKITKAQLLSSKQFSDKKDLLNALLSDNEKYTVKAVEEKINKYMKGKVK